MESKRKGGTALIALGLLLIAAALFLIGYNLFDEYRAGKTARRVLAMLREQAPIDAGIPEVSSPGKEVVPDYVRNPDMEMPTREVEGNDYIGILEIPSLELSLPVMSRWSYPKLKIAPCRYSGSAYEGNLTIVAHNYRTHFASVRDVPVGTRVLFTDVKGRIFAYEVAAIETVEANAVQEVVNAAWDLTLVTCTPGGQARVAVRCVKAG